MTWLQELKTGENHWQKEVKSSVWERFKRRLLKQVVKVRESIKHSSDKHLKHWAWSSGLETWSPRQRITSNVMLLLWQHFLMCVSANNLCDPRTLRSFLGKIQFSLSIESYMKISTTRKLFNLMFYGIFQNYLNTEFPLFLFWFNKSVNKPGNTL